MNNLTSTFSALGDPTRFAIIERLLASGEQSAGELQDVANISAPAISRHLKVLHEAGLVNRKINRQQRLYSLRPEAFATVGSWFISHQEFWAKSLNRLEAALKKESN